MKTVRLSKEEESELISSYQILGCIASRDKLIESQMGMVIEMARKKRHGNLEAQRELIQEGCIGLIEGINRFRPDLGNRLCTFVYHTIHGAMLDSLRKSADIYANHESTNDEALSDHLDTNKNLLDDVMRDEVVQQIDTYLSHLDCFKRDCFMSGNSSYATIRETANNYNTSHQNVDYHSQKVRKGLMRSLCKGL